MLVTSAELLLISIEFEPGDLFNAKKGIISRNSNVNKPLSENNALRSEFSDVSSI